METYETTTKISKHLHRTIFNNALRYKMETRLDKQKCLESDENLFNSPLIEQIAFQENFLTHIKFQSTEEKDLFIKKHVWFKPTDFGKLIWRWQIEKDNLTLKVKEAYNQGKLDMMKEILKNLCKIGKFELHQFTDNE